MPAVAVPAAGDGTVACGGAPVPAVGDGPVRLPGTPHHEPGPPPDAAGARPGPVAALAAVVAGAKPAATEPPAVADAAGLPVPVLPASADPSAQTPAPAAAAGPPAVMSAVVPASIHVARSVHVAAAPQLSPAGIGACVERIHELVRIAGLRDGHARATLQLRPAELGQVAVHLRTSDVGLIATIRAHDAAAVSALQQAGAELRGSLENRGVTLARIDIQLAAGGGGEHRGHHAAAGERTGRGARRSAGDDGDALVAVDAAGPSTTTIRTDGALVDVHA